MIGVFDSGSGGLTVFDALRRALPDQAFVYLGDHRRAPYGTRADEEIEEFTRQGASFLFEEGCGLVLLACNTASAVALRRLQESWLPQISDSHRVLGVVIPMIEQVTGLKWDRFNPGTSDDASGSVAVFGTQKTIDSHAFAAEILRRAPNVSVTEVACPGLVDALERMAPRSEIRELVASAVESMLNQMAGKPPTAAILGCTHFPLAEDIFCELLPNETRIVSQPDVIAESLVDYLRRHPEFSTPGAQGARVRYCTTADDAHVPSVAWLGSREVPAFEFVSY